MGNILTVAIGIAIFAYAAFTIYKTVKRTVKGGPGCGCGCDDGAETKDEGCDSKSSSGGCSGCIFGQNGSACHSSPEDSGKPDKL